jgi:hypothetical protein
MRGFRLPFLRAAVGAAVICACTGLAQATTVPAQASGSIVSKTLVSSVTLAKGVVLRHYRAAVSGLPRQQIYEVRWPLGDTHLRLHSQMLGTDYPASQSVAIRTMSSWYRRQRPPGLLAALNGDYFTYTSDSTAKTSGMFVRHKVIYRFGPGGSPAIGFRPDGKMVMGEPLAIPTRFLLPGSSATVRKWNSRPPSTVGDQVSAYTGAGRTVSIPAGYRAVIIRGRPFATVLHGSNRYANPTGSKVSELVSAFSLAPVGVGTTTASFPISAPSTGATSVTVPYHGAVLLLPMAGAASSGFSTLLAAASPSVKMSVADPAWADVTDVIGGKPQVVTDGVPTSKRDQWTTYDQWANPQWRPAIATTTSGRGMMVVIGSRTGTSTTGSQFARMLAQLGVKNAMQLDNRSSTELFAPHPNFGGCVSTHGTCYSEASGWERAIPVAITLSYR